MLKGRCCVLFRDLQVMLLRPQRQTEAPGNNNNSTGDPNSNQYLQTEARRLQRWNSGASEDPVLEIPVTEKRDERFSFISYAEGTPVCRICFQGPEQVRSEYFLSLVRFPNWVLAVCGVGMFSPLSPTPECLCGFFLRSKEGGTVATKKVLCEVCMFSSRLRGLSPGL